MLYTPMLPEAASGTLEPRHVVVPLRVMCPHAELILGHATRARRGESPRPCRLRRTGARAGGRRTSSSSSPSAPSRAPCRFPASRSTRSASSRSPTRSTSATTSCASSRPPLPTRENAERHLTFVFVGAGYAGVEALGELSDLVRDALRYYPELKDAPQHWVLVDAAPTILPEIPRRLGEYAARELAKRGVDIRVSTTLDSLDAESADPLGRDAPRDAHARLDGRRARRTRSSPSSASRSTSAAG